MAGTSLADVQLESQERLAVPLSASPLHPSCTPALALKRQDKEAAHWLADDRSLMLPRLLRVFFLAPNQTSRPLRVKLPFGKPGGRDLY